MANLIYIEKKNWDIIYPFFKKYFNEKYDENNRCITVNSNKFLMHVDKVLCGSLKGITDEIIENYRIIYKQYYNLSLNNIIIHVYEEEKIAYKAFKVEEEDILYCQPSEEKFYYEEGKIYEIKNGLKLCEKGFHFCKKIENIYDYYHMLSDVKIHRVEILGNVINDEDDEISCTDKIKVLWNLENFEIKKILGNKYSEAIYHSDGVISSNAIFNSNFTDTSNAIFNSNYITCGTCIDGSEDIELSSCVKNSMKVSSSESVSYSNFVNTSKSINSSKSVFYSESVCNSNGILRSRAISNSIGVISSFAINDSIGVLNSSSISKGLFVYDMECKKYVIFNKEVSKNRFDDIFIEAKLKMPFFMNFSYFIKRDCRKEYLDWGNCSQFFDFIKSLDEYDEDIFNKIIKEGVLV